MNDFDAVDQFLADFNTSQYATSYAEDLNVTREDVSTCLSHGIFYATSPRGKVVAVPNEQSSYWDLRDRSFDPDSVFFCATVKKWSITAVCVIRSCDTRLH